MKLRTQPVAKQPQQPYTRCLHVRLGHRLSSCFMPTACCIADTAAESLTPLTAPFALPAALPTLTLIDIEAHCPLFRYFLDALPSGEPWRFGDLELMGTIGAVRARVLEGVGVAVLPLYFIDHDLAAGRLRKLRPEVTLHHDFFRLIWHEEQVQPQLLETLAGELRTIPLT